MKKTLYSMMLSDDVVLAVDALAHQMGVSRSAMVNQILAEYLAVPTPEQQINQIFQTMMQIFSPSSELVPFFTPNSPSMSMKSSLAYKYRPTVKYEVYLHNSRDSLGTLNVVFRTQSAALIADMTDFLRLWVQIENQSLAALLGHPIDCALYNCKFVRPIAQPENRNCSADDIAGAISSYVQLFDRLLKGALSGQLSPADVDAAYQIDLQHRSLLL